VIAINHAKYTKFLKIVNLHMNMRKRHFRIEVFSYKKILEQGLRVGKVKGFLSFNN
jgi:hypothetical protein